MAEVRQLLRLQEQSLIPALRLDRQPGRLAALAGAHGGGELLVDRLLSRGGVAQVAPALADAQVGDSVEEPLLPDAHAQLRQRLQVAQPGPARLGRHDRQAERVLIGI
jgi:hypothetical protein